MNCAQSYTNNDVNCFLDLKSTLDKKTNVKSSYF